MNSDWVQVNELIEYHNRFTETAEFTRYFPSCEPLQNITTRRNPLAPTSTPPASPSTPPLSLPKSPAAPPAPPPKPPPPPGPPPPPHSSRKSHSDSPHRNAVLKSVLSLSFSSDINVVYLVEIKSAEGVHFATKVIGLGWVSMEFIGVCRINWGNGIDGVGFGFRTGCRSGCRHGGIGSMGLGEREAVAA
ncbi:hypothetical protein Droror1_Dr00021612 [Drosera rotundifolia]